MSLPDEISPGMVHSVHRHLIVLFVVFLAPVFAQQESGSAVVPGGTPSHAGEIATELDKRIFHVLQAHRPHGRARSRGYRAGSVP